jgi:TolB-like protein/Tfp pilus assembly protein PilF
MDGTPGTTDAIYRFLDCELDLSTRELRRGGRPETLQPKVFDLIAYLVANRERALGKDELQQALWPNVIVTEASLTQAIRKARRALGDDANAPHIIRTVHGRGYRFVAALEDTAARALAPPPGAHTHAAARPAAVEPASTTGASRRPRVAVLPFVNLSSDAEQEYFSDAITQDIIDNLSKHHWLDVLTRNATFGYKGSDIDTVILGQILGADYLVSGSVRRVGSRIRVTAELAAGASSRQLWADRYDRELEDVFAVQDEITRMITARIEPAIGYAERQRAVRSGRRDLDAWDCYHRGVWHFFRFTAQDNAEAQRLLQRSRELDPGFGEAHAWWAYAVMLGMVYWDTTPAPALLDEALAATRKALSIDDQNAVFYALEARVQIARGEYESASAENALAIRLNPTLAAAYCGLGDTLAYMGRFEEAIENFELAINLSPNDPQRWAFLSYGALALIFKGDYTAAVQWADRASVIPNCQYWTRAHKAVALAYLGKLDAAGDCVRQLLAEKPNFCRAFARQKLFYLKDPRQLALYLAGLEKAGVPE